MTFAIRIILVILGAAALVICLSIMFLGPGATASVFEHVFDALTGYPGPDSGPWPPTMDSELRFYAPFWGAYGLVLLDTARDLRRGEHRIGWLAAIFFAGGLGRALSWAATGRPHPFFMMLMAIELMLPPLLVLMAFLARRHKAAR